MPINPELRPTDMSRNWADAKLKTRALYRRALRSVPEVVLFSHNRPLPFYDVGVPIDNEHSCWHISHSQEIVYFILEQILSFLKYYSY